MKALSVREAAKVFGCSASFLYREVREGRIPEAIRFGTKVLFDEDDVDAIIEHYRVRSRAS